MNIDEAIAACPLVAILRGISPDEIVDHAAVLIEAGLRAIEIPLNSPDPLESLQRLAAAFGDQAACGAGTVLRVSDVQPVVDSGGTIIVAPDTRPDVIAEALRLGVSPAPGFATATEAFSALSAGARHLKLFPSATYGPQHLKQLRAVLPQSAVVWAVGGVGADTLQDWWSAGARAFGIGSELYSAGRDPIETRVRAGRLVDAARALIS